MLRIASTLSHKGRGEDSEVKFLVMPGLAPGIHVFLANPNNMWMAGINPVMTQ
jgi:hypothetical protein